MGSPGEAFWGPALKLLYIEDNADAAADLTSLLAREGHQVVWEMRGADGLRRAALEPFDTIILDRMLPDMDGLQIVERLRESGVDAPEQSRPCRYRWKYPRLARPSGPNRLHGRASRRIVRLHRQHTLQSDNCLAIAAAIDSYDRPRARLREVPTPGIRPRPLRCCPAGPVQAWEPVSRRLHPTPTPVDVAIPQVS